MPTDQQSTARPSADALATIASLFDDIGAEFASTRRVLERFPDGRGDWRPHPKSRTLAQLATHVADIPNRGAEIIQTDELNVAGRTPLEPLGSAAELLALFDASARRFQEAAAADIAELARVFTLRNAAHVVMQAPKRSMLRPLMIGHLIHHRAQLGVYYRLLDVPVPGVYGPSADDPLPGGRVT